MPNHETCLRHDAAPAPRQIHVEYRDDMALIDRETRNFFLGLFWGLVLSIPFRLVLLVVWLCRREG